MLFVIIASITFIISVLAKVFDYIEKTRSVSRNGRSYVSLSLTLLMFLSYGLWMVHGIMLHDNTLIYGQGFGLLTTGLLVWQLVWKRRNS